MKQARWKCRRQYAGWAWLLLVLAVAADCSTYAQSTPPQQLRITILDGEGSLNNIRERTAREPIVQVEDQNHKPVAGALVLFAVHGQGDAGATFANGLTTYQTTTDALGHAVAKGLVPNGHAGSFTISAAATNDNVTASVVIHQQNIVPNVSAGNAAQPHHFAITMGNVAFVGVVAAVGAVLGWSAVNSGTASTTITTGTGGVGPPQTGTAAIRHR